jgi:hypothetical protein
MTDGILDFLVFFTVFPLFQDVAFFLDPRAGLSETVFYEIHFVPSSFLMAGCINQN